MIIHNMEQGTPEWHAVRAGKITASNIKLFAGKSKTRESEIYTKAAEVLTGKVEIIQPNFYMKRGSELEPEAREAYRQPVTQVGFIEVDPFCGVSPDGMVGDDGLIEIKVPMPKNFIRQAVTNEVDPAYIHQMQMQMWACERQWCDYVIYHPDFPDPVHIIRFDRDEKIIKGIISDIERAKEDIKAIVEKYNDVGF